MGVNFMTFSRSCDRKTETPRAKKKEDKIPLATYSSLLHEQGLLCGFGRRSLLLAIFAFLAFPCSRSHLPRILVR